MDDSSQLVPILFQRTLPLLGDCLEIYLNANTKRLFRFLLDPLVSNPKLACLIPLLDPAQTGIVVFVLALVIVHGSTKFSHSSVASFS